MLSEQVDCAMLPKVSRLSRRITSPNDEEDCLSSNRDTSTAIPPLLSPPLLRMTDCLSSNRDTRTAIPTNVVKCLRQKKKEIFPFFTLSRTKQTPKIFPRQLFHQKVIILFIIKARFLFCRGDIKKYYSANLIHTLASLVSVYPFRFLYIIISSTKQY